MPTIAIICSIDEIVPYSLGDQPNNLRHFSLNLSVSFTNDSAGGVPASPNVFMPWRWTLNRLKFLASTGAAGTAPAGTPAVPVIVNPVPLPVPAAVQGTLEARFADPNPPDPPNPRYYCWSDQPGGQAPAGAPAPPLENWSRVLAHASTWPAPVPPALNLSFHFTIPSDQLNAPAQRLFAAPEFTVDGVTYTLQNLPAAAASGHSAFAWTYATAGGPAPQPGDPVYQAFQQEYVLQPLPSAAAVANPGPFFDFNTYWIAPAPGANPAPEAVASEDWRSNLESKATDAFDLVQRVLVVLRTDQTNATTLLDGVDPTIVWKALVAALRDNADFGLRYAPDGLNTLRFVLQRPSVVKVRKLSESDFAILESALANAVPPPPQTFSDYWNSKLKAVTGVDVTRAPKDTMSVLNAADSLQRAVASTGVLASLLYQQWDDFLKASPAAKTLWGFISQAVRDELTTLSTSRTLRSRMLQANLGGDGPDIAVWKALTDLSLAVSGGYTVEIAQIMTNLEMLIPAWFRKRFGLPPVDPPHESLFAGRQPAVVGWTVDLSAKLHDDAATFQDLLFHNSVQQPTRGSHPIIVQIGDTADPEDNSATPLSDLSRRIAGVGLLVREKPHNGNNPLWTCANIANLHSDVNPGGGLIANNAIAPLRQKKRNNLKQPVLAYSGGSLVAQADTNPASDAFPARDAFADQNPNTTSLFRYSNDTDNTVPTVTVNGNQLSIAAYNAPTGTVVDDWQRVPSLKTGRSYQLLPFMVGNNGALPFKLLAAGNPTVGNPGALVTPQGFDATGLDAFIRTIKYARRVAVGPARIGNDGPAQGQLPPIPSTVVPLVRDFQPAAGTSTTPLLLLWNTPANDYSSFTFTLRPPACDRDTFEHWVAGLDDLPPDPVPAHSKFFRNTLIAVATAQTLFAAKTLNDPSAPDLSIDDPAVTAFTLTLTQIYPPPAAGTQPLKVPSIGMFSPKPLASPLDASSAQSLMTCVQDSGIPIKCSILPGGPGTGPAALNPDGSVVIPEGQIWSLSVAPVIPLQSANFEGLALTTPPATFDLLIEAATTGAFAPGADTSTFAAELFNNLALAVDSKRSLTATIQPAQHTNWDLIHNIDIRKQAWRWMGRPLGALPAEWTNHQSGPALDAAPVLEPMNSRMWEIASFAERDDEDCAITQRACNFTALAAANLDTSDLSADTRAQYYRFGIDAHSRYEGLPGLLLAPVQARITDAGATTSTPWRRCVVPPVVPPADPPPLAPSPAIPISSALPRPKVLFAIPLLEPAPIVNPPQTPGILVVSNEQWFDQWGLAEELTATLDQARDPSVPLAVPTSQANPIPESGPNPILSASRFKDLVPNDLGPTAPLDPMGATFDQGTSSALFANTTFELNPSNLGLPASGVEHFLARVRFNRSVRGDHFGLNQVQSQASDPFQIEFHPGDRQINAIQGGVTTATDVATLRFTTSVIPAPDANSHPTAVLSFSNPAGAVQLQSGPPQSGLFDLSHLQLWALLFTKIQDVTGKARLSCVSIFVQEPSNPQEFIWQDSDTPSSVIDRTNCLVYLVEVLTVQPAALLPFRGGIRAAADLLLPAPVPSQQPGDTPARKQRLFITPVLPQP